MTHLTLAASFLVVWQAQAATSLEGVKKAERFAAAIEGKADFQDADFTKALSIQEKTALKGFGKCKVAQIGYATVAHPIQKNVVEQDPDELGVALDCAGVPDETPVAISLHLQNGRIARVETHNADLMKGY